MAKTRLSENLHWNNLADKFYIKESESKSKKVPHVVCNGKLVPAVSLQEAIANGTILGFVTSDAEAFHEGDVAAVLLQLKKNLNNWKCVAKAPTKLDRIRYQLLTDFCNNLLPEYKRASGKARAQHDASSIYVNNVRKPQWAYNAEDLATIDDVNRVIAIIHSIADVCAGKGTPERNIQWLGEDYLVKAVENREAAYARRDELQSKRKSTDLNKVLADKLAAFGSDKVFTAEELMALLKS